MSTSSSSNGASIYNVVDATPLLHSAGIHEDDRGRRTVRRNSLRDAARFIRRASSRRMMREPSLLVRETAAEQLEERQSDWAYSRPVVALDILWNFVFVVSAVMVMVMSRDESPPLPLRLWIVGYALQCVLHMVCVCLEYWRRRRRPRLGALAEERSRSSGSSANSSYVSLARHNGEATSSVAKHLESANTMFSFIWWIIGFYWVSISGQALARDSPQLYWLCILFLAFDVFFVVFCVALASFVGIAVCCCLPCIIAILYAVADQEGASREDIEKLSKYIFLRTGDTEKLNSHMDGTFAGVMTECVTDSPMEHPLSQEDADCCICLCGYEDGVELRELPCGHHFHCTCVDKWLLINATCPLCKYNISKSSSYHGGEEV